MKKYITKQSNIKGAGKGLFTKAPFKKGEVIGLAHVDDQPYLEIGHNHNHNEKNPTAFSKKIDNKRYIFALRDLEPNEEITTNYRLQPELEQPEDFQKKKGGMVSLPTDKPEKSKKFSRSLDATNRLFTKNYLFEKPKSRKNKIFDPHAKYYAEGGQYEEAELTPEEIEAYRAEGYTVDDTEYKEGGDISVPSLNQMQDGGSPYYSYGNKKYIKKKDGTWFVESNGEYVPLTENVKARTAELNKNAKYNAGSGEAKTLGLDGKYLTATQRKKIKADKATRQKEYDNSNFVSRMWNNNPKFEERNKLLEGSSSGLNPYLMPTGIGPSGLIKGVQTLASKAVSSPVVQATKTAYNTAVPLGKTITSATAGTLTPANLVNAGFALEGAYTAPENLSKFIANPNSDTGLDLGFSTLEMLGLPGMGNVIKQGIGQGKNIVNSIDNAVYPTRTYRAEVPGGNLSTWDASDLSKKVFNKGDFSTKSLDDVTQYLSGSEGGRKGLLTGQDMNLTEYKVPFWKKNVSFDPDVIELKKSQNLFPNSDEYIIPNNKFLYPRKTTLIKAVPEELKTFQPDVFSGDLPYEPYNSVVMKQSNNFASKPFRYIEDQLNAVTGHNMPLTYKFDPSIRNQVIPNSSWKQPQFPVNKSFKYGGLNKFIKGGPNNCPNDMIWDAELQDCIINAPINPNEEPINTYEFESMTPDQILARDAENLKKEQETWTDAQWDAYEKAEEVKVKAEAKIKAEEAYNKALINEPQYADEALNFVKGWHDSPMYNQMVLNSYKGNQKNADYLTKLRKKNIATIPAINIMPNQENAEGTSFDSSNVAAWSKSDTGQVEVFPAGFEYGPSLYAHEYLHSSDRPRELYDYDHPSYADGNSPDWMFYNDQRFPDDGLVMHNRVMPKSDQMYITNNRSSNWKDNENYKLEKEEGKYALKTDEELKQELISNGLSPDDPLFTENFNAAKKQNVEDIKWSQNWNKKHWKEYGHDYISNPTETRARLGEIRLQAKKENIYDPYTEQITPEIFQNYINKKREDSNFAPMKPIDELRNEFTDEEILYMLQNISKNPNPQKEEEGAEGVMKYGGLHKFAGGAEVERPCPKGYIFDPIFRKCVTEMQYKIARLTKSNYNPANADKAIIENERYRKANNYLTAYYASPKYKEMLKRSSSSPENYNYIFNARNKQLATTPPLLLLSQPEDSPTTGGQSDSSTGQIELFPEGYGTVGTAVHELSHSSDRPLPGGVRLMPASDKEYIRLHKAKVLGDSRDYHNDNEYYNYGDAQKDFQKFYTNYVGKDTETRARLNAIRQGAKENGLYDPFTQGVSKDLYYKKLKNFNFEKGNKSGFDPMEQLKGAFSDEEIIWMLNNISKNKNKQEEGIVEGTAKKGGFIETELTPEEIERYRKEGYTIEELD